MDNQHVGLLTGTKSGGVVVLDKADKAIGRMVNVPERFLHGAPFGMKVVVGFMGLDRAGNAYGKIVEVLGDPARPDVAILGIVRQYGLREAFDDEVLAETNPWPHELDDDAVTAALAEGYRDLRHLQTMTIDGEDAKDLDDAIDIVAKDKGRTTLFVHIADVAHYVRPGTSLDDEAYVRGNSVYLVDRVLPMLPAKLSNGLCSLNPGVPRRALTCEMDVDGTGRVVNHAIYNSIIESKVRASYEEVYALLQDGEQRYERPAWFLDKLVAMRTLADVLARKRKNRGTLDFDFPETKVVLDADGHPTDIYPYPITFANKIIEEFMIVANETVAEHLIKHNLPGIYRIHEDPDPVKLAMFAQLSSRLGFSLRGQDKISPKALGDILQKLKGKPFEQTLSQMLLRSLAKAEYSAQNLGHFGLASKYYLHFTSPIRRYADLIVHRSLKAWLKREKLGLKASQLQAIAEHISDTERIAVAAERDTVDQKAAEFFQHRIGEHFSGIVSGFAKGSVFVQLENTIEGAIFFRTLDGYYRYDETRLAAIGDRGQSIHIGDRVVVEVASVDINRRFIDFTLIEHAEAVRAFSSRRAATPAIPVKEKKKVAKRLHKSQKRVDKRRSR